MKSMPLAAAAAIVFAAPAAAQVTIDGNLDAAYGGAKAFVQQSPGTPPNGNFQAPTQFSDTAYRIHLTSDANNVYGFLQSDSLGIGPFANLYFDLDPANNNGSDLGFEINPVSVTAFVPGRNGQPGFNTVLSSSLYSLFAQSNVVEFALSNSLFNQPIPGLIYYSGQEFPTNGGDIVLRLSQSFGFAVAGGATFGADRLGRVTVAAATPAVPEPATWAMMMLGFGGVGYAMRRRPAQRARIRFA